MKAKKACINDNCSACQKKTAYKDTDTFAPSVATHSHMFAKAAISNSQMGMRSTAFGAKQSARTKLTI